MPSYFLTTIRQSARILSGSRIYTIINLSGLVMGLSMAFLLLIFAINELTVNNFQSKADRLYRLLVTDAKGLIQPIMPYRVKSVLDSVLPEGALTFRIMQAENILGDAHFKVVDKKEKASPFIFADPEIFRILDFEFVAGMAPASTAPPELLCCSEKGARQLAGLGIMLGQYVTFEIGGMSDSLLLGGIYRDLHPNSTIRPDFIAGTGCYFNLLKRSIPDFDLAMAENNEWLFDTYILNDGNSAEELLQEMITRACPAIFSQEHHTLRIQPFKEIYLDDRKIENDFTSKGSLETIYILLSLAFFVLLLATINYSLLTTARAALRYKEIGIRKVLGATHGQIRMQLLAESVLLTLVAFPLTFLMLGLIIPSIERFFVNQFFFFTFNLTRYLFFTFLVTVVIGLLSGSYVAIYLAGLNPVAALKSNFFFLRKVHFSKVFMVIQLFITAGLLISLIIISQQVKMFLNPTYGSGGQIITIDLDGVGTRHYHTLKQRFSGSDHVLSVSGTSVTIPSQAEFLHFIKFPPPLPPKVRFEIIYIDHGFFTTFDIPVILKNDSIKSHVVNGTGAFINRESLKYIDNNLRRNSRISSYIVEGAVENFSIHTLHNQIIPTLYVFDSVACRTILVKYRHGHAEAALNDLDKIWKEIYPGMELPYRFFKEELNSMYKREQNFGRIVGAFTIVAFAITGMGLFGMAMLIAERRLREMSIRKVFGARNRSIIYLIQKELLVAIIFASLLAMPVTWLLVSTWLDQFHYHVPVRFYILILGCLAVGSYVSLILFFKTLRILRESPANALKYE